MRPARANFATAARRLLALGLGLWLSGAACLVCCERKVTVAHAGSARAHARGPREAAPETSPAVMSANHSCCKARVGSRARAEVKDDAPPAARVEVLETARHGGPEARPETVPGRACCRRILRSAEQPRKPRAEPAQAQAPTSNALPAATTAPHKYTFNAARPRAPDRGGTYLLCRALLI